MTVKGQTLTTPDALNIMTSDYLQQNLHCAKPALIQNLNFKDNKLISIDAQPVIRRLITDQNTNKKTTQALPVIKNIPYTMPQSQTLGLSIRIPVQIGDECLLIFADRSLDNWQERGGFQDPVEDTIPRKHDLTDAIAILGISSNITAIDNYNNDVIEISNKEHDTVFKLSDTDIDATVKNANFNITDGEINSSVSGSTFKIGENEIKLNIGSSSITLINDLITIKSYEVITIETKPVQNV